MLNQDSNSPCGILYIDDEEKALKYFRLAFGSKFKIFTATSGPGGMEVLRRESGQIGIVLSDQRMPEMLGAEFLGMVRQGYPHIVRILTTAYSDLESAIQAVNTGHIYQYVVKPWEIPDLAMVLQRAADYYHVLSERNELLALKMTTLQRIICSDRLKWLLLSSRSFTGAEQSAFRRAVVALVKAMPEYLQPSATGPGTFSKRQFEITGLIRDEYRNASRCLDLMDALRSEVAAATGDAVAKSLEAFVSALTETCGLAPSEVSLEIDAASNAQVRLPSSDAGKLARVLFGLLVEPETPDASTLLFGVLVTLAHAGRSLTIQVADSDSYVFSPQTDSNADQTIDELYKKFSASDISRL